MKHIIIGTAGHIDHGKTTLIKALTGRETDRLKEEKDRGISIDLGFTFFDLPSGRRAGMIDVPGHEKFIKNMLAGASSIDIVLLVVAADEGIMPQTREHIDILQLLSIKKGIVVITKCDIVDEDWLEMIKEQLREELKDTFLEAAPNVEVSSKTGKGIDDLIAVMDRLTEEIQSKDTEGNFRLPVDRAFSISGFGTIVTGTVVSGRIKEGEVVEIYPSKEKSKVRSIQVHEQGVPYAEAGQRAALNLSNIKVEEVKRGSIVAGEDMLEPSLIADCSMQLLKSAEKSVKNRERVRLYHGTEEFLCRVIILDKDEIKPGEKAYVQLRLEKPLTSLRKDRFVIRTYSPMHTIAGGIIIEPVSKKAKSYDLEHIEQLKLKESEKDECVVENIILNSSKDYPDLFYISKALGRSGEELENILQKLLKDRKILKFNAQDKDIFIHRNYMEEKAASIEAVLENFHKENSLRLGMSKEEIKNKVFSKNIRQKLYDDILQELSNRMVIKNTNGYISLLTFQIKQTKDQIKLMDFILDKYEKAKYSPPKYEDLSAVEKDKKKFGVVYDYLIQSGSLVKNSQECILLKDHYEAAKKLIVDYIKANGSITAGECRDLLSTTRKFSVAILEYLDWEKVTKRVEDKRILY